MSDHAWLRDVTAAEAGAAELRRIAEDLVALCKAGNFDESGEKYWADDIVSRVDFTFHDARKGVRELDVTDAEAEKMGGRSGARRGRRPKSVSS